MRKDKPEWIELGQDADKANSSLVANCHLRPPAGENKVVASQKNQSGEITAAGKWKNQ